MIKLGICGHFGIGLNLLNGQTIKTKIVANEFRKQLGEEQVDIVDTHGGVKRVLSMCIETIGLFHKCENIMIAPARRGLLMYVPICTLYNFFYHRKLHYIVIGGWLNEYLNEHPRIEKKLKKFETICVETATMKTALEKRGFANIVILPNCKELKEYHLSELPQKYDEPYEICTFSRVMKEKGIEDIVNVVQVINESIGRVVYKLDIYGSIWKSYQKDFAKLQKTFPEYICYRGEVDFNKSTETLKKYFFLMFPTKFYTEGIPGTIIDAYAAGIPVVSAKWESYDDIVTEGITGLGYSFGDLDALRQLLVEIVQNPQMIIKLKGACLQKSRELTPQFVIGKFIENYF